MEGHALKALSYQGDPPGIVLVGNPNVGKSVLFGFLTGRYVTVSNYPGTTVEVASGMAALGGRKVKVQDTPGIHSLVPMSEEEQVARDLLLKEKGTAVVLVADAKNLSRALLLTLQIVEMRLPCLLDLNMEDEVASVGMSIDKERLESLLGIPVVGTVAIQKKGLRELKKRVTSLPIPSFQFAYSAPIEKGVQKLEALLPESSVSKRSIALMILAGDESLKGWLHENVNDAILDRIVSLRKDLARRYSEPLAYVIHRQRQKIVGELMEAVVRQERPPRIGWLGGIGRLSMHPVWGLFVLGGVLFLVYEFVGKFGAQTAVDWLEKGLFGQVINPWAQGFFKRFLFFSPFLQDLFVGPFGIVTMALTYALAIILPIVTTFFLAFSFMEDSGYLPRLSIMLNRIFHFMGLNGKAVVPMVLGLGCDTMATMTARILETRKERVILTLLLALGVPCSAQLGIILGMLAVLPYWATVLWTFVVVGSILSVGFLSSRLLRGERSDFIMEIPPIRRPTVMNVVTKTLARLEWYVREVVPLFVIGTLVLFFLDKARLLPKIQDAANPLVVRFLHLPREATEAFLVGFLRRDYGATHFFDLFTKGRLDAIQTVVALIVITLFIPCLANLLMIVKERGVKVATAIMVFIYPFSFLVGGIVNWGLRL